MFNIKLQEMSSKMSFKALVVKIQQSKNQHGGGGKRSIMSSRGADRVKFWQSFNQWAE